MHKEGCTRVHSEGCIRSTPAPLSSFLSPISALRSPRFTSPPQFESARQLMQSTVTQRPRRFIHVDLGSRGTAPLIKRGVERRINRGVLRGLVYRFGVPGGAHRPPAVPVRQLPASQRPEKHAKVCRRHPVNSSSHSHVSAPDAAPPPQRAAAPPPAVALMALSRTRAHVSASTTSPQRAAAPVPLPAPVAPA